MARVNLDLVPGVRSGRRIRRTIHSEIAENKARLDQLGEDTAVLLEASAAIRSEITALMFAVEDAKRRIGVTSSQTEAESMQARLDLLERAMRELGDTIVKSLEAHDQQSLSRLGAARRELVSLGQPWDWSETWSSDGSAVTVALCSYLAPLLHADSAIDVGAHPGGCSTALVQRGLQVLAVEPDAEPALTVDRLRQERGWPEEVGLVKVDAEGAELEVLGGFAGTRPELLVVEIRSEDDIRVTDRTRVGIAPLLEAVKPLGYRRWIALIRRHDAVTFAVNPISVPPTASGSVVFIRDRDTFIAAADWCSRRVLREPASHPSAQ